MILKHRIFAFLVCILISLPASTQTNKTLLFVVSHPGSAPYLYLNKELNQYQGVIPDVLHQLIATDKINVRYISNSRKRSEEYIYQGQADLMMLSKSWLSHPERIIASEALHEHRSYLYKITPFTDDFSLDDQTKRDPICTRQGFIYPNLYQAFKTNRLFKVDSSNHLSMMSMLFKERCTFVIMNEYNALTIMNSGAFRDKKLYRSKRPISTVPLNIILRPSLVTTKKVLDKHINFLKKSGEMSRIIERHTLNIH